MPAGMQGRKEEGGIHPSGADGREGPVLVSACLLGVRCRYDGESRKNEEVVSRLKYVHAGNGPALQVIPVCPEQIGGLPTPRAPCELVGISGEAGTGEDVLAGRARVIDEAGQDRTPEYLRGAEETLRLARLLGARRAILKTDSPSCDPARGVTAAVLRREGFEIEGA